MDYQQPFVARPNSHLVLAILTTLCCCSPFGLIAIYKASKVHDYVVIKQYYRRQIADFNLSRNK